MYFLFLLRFIRIINKKTIIIMYFQWGSVNVIYNFYIDLFFGP